MALSVKYEVLVFFKTIVGGVLLGIIFDVYRTICRGKKSLFLMSISDVLVWIAMSFAAFFTVFSVNSGCIRWFEAAAMLIGFILYSVFLSKYFLMFFDFLSRLMKKTVNILLVPLNCFKKFFKKLFFSVKRSVEFVVFWIKLQKKRLCFIKNQQIFDFRRLNQIFRKN